jgi:hypothetical protein
MTSKPMILLLLCASMTTQAAESQQLDQQSDQQSGEQESHAPGIELPEGEGRVLLLAACTRCHDLRGLPAYKGYWSAGQWRSMIETMIKNGAPLNQDQTSVLAEYLAQHFGRPAANPE